MSNLRMHDEYITTPLDQKSYAVIRDTIHLYYIIIYIQNMYLESIFSFYD